MSSRPRCLVVGDHPVARLGVRHLLEPGCEVEEAPCASEAVQLMTGIGDFDVAIVDMGVPADDRSTDASGTATIRSLLDLQPSLGVVAYCDAPERHLVGEAESAGASGFVMKGSEPDQLRRAVDAALSAERFVDPAATGDRPAITKRQREILQLVADGNPTSTVAKRLGLSPETVKTHTKHILAKLDAHDRAHAVAIAMRNALIR